MREITLDVTPFEEKISLHRYLKEALNFPFYYGANLDALHDELTSESAPVRITVVYPQCPRAGMEEYLPRLLQVFQNAARENYHIQLTLESRES